VFAVVQIGEFRAEAKIQHILGEVNEFERPRFTEISTMLANRRIDRKEERLKPLDPNEPPLQLYDALNFCEDLGLLTRRGALDPHDVWDEFGYWLFPIYTDGRPVIDASRNQDGPATFNECDWLIEKIRPIELREDGGKQDHPSEQDIYDLYCAESDAEPGQHIPRGRHPQRTINESRTE
jgi:hypothetical protein